MDDKMKRLGEFKCSDITYRNHIQKNLNDFRIIASKKDEITGIHTILMESEYFDLLLQNDAVPTYDMLFDKKGLAGVRRLTR